MANAEKVAAVAELTERFKDSSGAVLTDYRGLTVAQLAELRRSLEDHATFAVVKNTLTKIAVTEADPLLVIKGGVLDGKTMTPSEITKLADLEPREMLLAKLAGAMKASLAGAAATFNALPVQMALLADALRAKVEAGAPAGAAPEADSAAQAAEDTQD